MDDLPQTTMVFHCFRLFFSAGSLSKERTPKSLWHLTKNKHILKYQLKKAHNDLSTKCGININQQHYPYSKTKDLQVWSPPYLCLLPRLSSPRGSRDSRETSKRTSDKKLPDRSGKLLSTRLGKPSAPAGEV